MTIQSFSNQALAYGASSPILNPDNQGQKHTSIYLGKPVRAIARFAFGITAVTIIPAVGTFYHLAKTIQCSIAYGTAEKTNERSKAWKHLKAGLVDGFIAATHILALGIIPLALANYIPQEIARINRLPNHIDPRLRPFEFLTAVIACEFAKTTTYSLIGFAAIIGIPALIRPIAFTLFPDSYKANMDQ